MDASIGVFFGVETLLSWGIADFFAKIAIGKFGGMRVLLIQQAVGFIAISGYMFVFQTIPMLEVIKLNRVEQTAEGK